MNFKNHFWSCGPNKNVYEIYEMNKIFSILNKIQLLSKNNKSL